MPQILSNEAAELSVLLRNDLVMLNPTILCTSLIVHVYLLHASGSRSETPGRF